MNNVTTKLSVPIVAVAALLAAALTGCVVQSAPTLEESFAAAPSGETIAAPIADEMPGVALQTSVLAGEAIQEGPEAI